MACGGITKEEVWGSKNDNQMREVNSMGCVYRPTYRDRAGNKRKSKIWWVQYYVNGKSFSEGTKTADHVEALRYLKRHEGEAAKGVPLIKGQQTVRFAELAQDLIIRRQMGLDP